jgi:hypothetical protein
MTNTITSYTVVDAATGVELADPPLLLRHSGPYPIAVVSVALANVFLTGDDLYETEWALTLAVDFSSLTAE